MMRLLPVKFYKIINLKFLLLSSVEALLKLVLTPRFLCITGPIASLEWLEYSEADEIKFFMYWNFSIFKTNKLNLCFKISNR